MRQRRALRCRHAFESATVHANGEVVCSIIDGRGEFVLGNVHQQSLADILAGPRRRELQRLIFNYGEPFVYRHLVDALRHIRRVSPSTAIAISTDGMQVRPHIADAIVSEQLLDWLIFSIDGCDEDSYRRYRIGGRFETAFANLTRFHRHAAGTRIRVIWQYVVFRWNDRDDQFKRAIEMAERLGVPIWFDFAHTWGRSRRRSDDLRYLTPYLKPYTALPGEARQEGW